MNDGTGIVRTGRKFEQVVEGAREVFMAEGFERASVDEIARVASVSKATLYSYFPDKSLMFTEVVRMEIQRMADEAAAFVTTETHVREVLLFAAYQIISYLQRPFMSQFFRICLAEQARFPHLAREFIAVAHASGRSRLEAYLQIAVTRGELKIDDIDIATGQFAEMCKVNIWTRILFGVQTEFSQEEIDRVAQSAVETFMARYGVK